jgi:ribosomal protein S3
MIRFEHTLIRISKVNSISNVKINRNGLNDQIQLNIETGKPGILVGDLVLD